MTWTTVPTQAGPMDVFVSEPAEPRGFGIVMLQEIFGVNEAMRRKAQAFADLGFTVALPDVYWRQERRVDLSYGETDRKKGFALMQGLDFKAAISDILDTSAWLRTRPGIRQVAAVGFCLGGKLAVMAAAKGGFDAVASFYGVQVDRNEAELAAITCPLQYHVGDGDEHIPADAVARIKALLEPRRNAEVFVYPGAQHGFYNASRPECFDAEAARMAQRHTVSMLEAVG